jgi:hypothetical protein
MADYMGRLVVHLSDIVAGRRGHLGDHTEGTLIFSVDYTLLVGGRHCDSRLDARGAPVLLQHMLVVAVGLVVGASSSLGST